jgi:hypothetical protein
VPPKNIIIINGTESQFHLLSFKTQTMKIEKRIRKKFSEQVFVCLFISAPKEIYLLSVIDVIKI